MTNTCIDRSTSGCFRFIYEHSAARCNRFSWVKHKEGPNTKRIIICIHCITDAVQSFRIVYKLQKIFCLTVSRLWEKRKTEFYCETAKQRNSSYTFISRLRIVHNCCNNLFTNLFVSPQRGVELVLLFT